MVRNLGEVAAVGIVYANLSVRKKMDYAIANDKWEELEKASLYRPCGIPAKYPWNLR